ncbi:MAG: hypothetical protein ACJ76Y_04860 [Thermoanaerobaculia bacterium]
MSIFLIINLRSALTSNPLAKGPAKLVDSPSEARSSNSPGEAKDSDFKTFLSRAEIRQKRRCAEILEDPISIAASGACAFSEQRKEKLKNVYGRNGFRKAT